MIQFTHWSVAISTVSRLFQGTASVDDLGLVEPVDRFGQCVVVAVTFAAGRRLDAGFSPGETIKDPQEPTGEMQSRIFQTEIEMIQYLLRVKYVRR